MGLWRQDIKTINCKPQAISLSDMPPLHEEGEPSSGFQPSEPLIFTSDGGGTCDEHSTVLTLSQKHSELYHTTDKCQIESRITRLSKKS